jgi:hypothetical protein
MSKNKQNNMIPNWYYFGTHHCIIELIVFQEDEDDEPVYNSFIVFFLDDGEESSKTEDKQKVISINTEVYDTDKKACAIETIRHTVELFGSVSRMIYVTSNDGTFIEEFELEDDDLLDDFDRLEEDDDDDFYSMKIPKNRTLH